MTRNHKIVLGIGLLFVFLLRFRFGATLFGGEDAFQVYLIGLKWFSTGGFPYWGADVVYTATQIPGGLQAVATGGPFFVLPIPEAPFLVINLLSLAALCFFGWYLKKRIPGIPEWFMYGWLLTMPWMMHYSTQVENPSYVLPASVMFFISVWELLPMYENRLLKPQWAFFWMGFTLFWVMQVHLSWILMPPFILAAMLAQVKNSKVLLKGLAFFLFGAALTGALLAPTLLEFGTESLIGANAKASINWNNLTRVFDIGLQFMSFSSAEVARFIGPESPERTEFLRNYPIAAMFTLAFAVMGFIQVAGLTLSLFSKGQKPEWSKVRWFLLSAIGLTSLSFLFTNLTPKAPQYYLMAPVGIWYAMYCIEPWFEKRLFREFAVILLSCGAIFHLALAARNMNETDLYLRRAQASAAIKNKDYTLLGIRRESVLSETLQEKIWKQDGRCFSTGYEYQNALTKPQNIYQNTAHDGRYCNKMDSILSFGIDFREKWLAPSPPDSCLFSVWLKGDYDGNSLAVLDLKSEGKVVMWKGISIEKNAYNAEQWRQLKFSYAVEDSIRSIDEVRVFIWLNDKRPGFMFADDVQVCFK
ncbi:MAG: hypothetical protein JNJ57_12935 [Saprospiraceae bacterium]|nr:hypothetical protein [Saprospiraceae bacterium]